MSSSSLVLITGTTGHVGFKVLLDTLKLGYRTRLAVRSDSKKNVILTNPAFKALGAEDRVEFVIVPDLTAPGAYDKAVEGVDYILHIASPLAGNEEKNDEQYRKDLIEPAVHGTVGILESAGKYGPTVKRVIITSSVVALTHYKDMVGSAVRTPETRVPNDDGPYEGVPFRAYFSSKIAALNATEAWVAENKPKFDIVNIHPGFIEGRNDLILTPQEAFSGTNAIILAVATSNVGGNPLPGATVHLDDVSRMHVGALNTAKIPAGSYIAQWNPEGTTLGTRWEDVNAIIEKEFPEQIKSGLLKVGPTQTSGPAYFDSSKTEQVYGFKFLNLEEQVKSVVGHYVELLSQQN